MSQPYSPAMLRRRLGAELRALRERDGRASGEVAAVLGWSASKLSRAENGRGGLSQGDVRQLLDLYRVEDAQLRAEIDQMVERARERAWWEGYRLQDGYRAYIGLESAARALDMYNPQVIPGLLQTAEYARALSRAAAVTEELGEATVKTRLTRQELLGREQPPRIRVLLDEATVRRPVGGADVMRRQMRRLLELGETDVLTIRLLPFAIGAHACSAGPFIIVVLMAEVAGGEEERVVYADGFTGGVIRSRPDEVEFYRAAFDLAWNQALDQTATTELLRGLVEEYGGRREVQ